MGLYEYKIFSEKQQWDELWDNGKFITHYIQDDTKLTLYALYAFFVEVELSLNGNKILGKSTFVCGHSLEKYAGSIDINNL